MVIKGKVRHGKQRGVKLGYPTANIALPEPHPQGIYISNTLVEGNLLPSVTFIGSAITFGEEEVICETHILSFDKDIYNMVIEVELIKKIRDNKKFDTKEALIEQMEKDKEEAFQYFKNV